MGPVNERKGISLGRTNWTGRTGRTDAVAQICNRSVSVEIVPSREDFVRKLFARHPWSRSVWSARSLLPLSSKPAVQSASKLEHSKRFARFGCGLAAILAVTVSLDAQEHSSTNRFFLPQNPVAAAYILGRLSNQELIAAPRSEFVYVALLERRGLDRKYRVEALEGLSQIRKTDPVTELLRGLAEVDKKGEETTHTIQDLGQVLLRFPAKELVGKRASLEKLATESAMPVTRQIGFAAAVTTEQSFENSWNRAATNSSQL